MTHTLGSESRPLRVAVVGSGPSGFYAAGALFKQTEVVVEVDVFDRLPTPFGLVRGGVAPDHQKIKNVIRVYNKTAANGRFRFFGHVRIGLDLEVKDLLRHYDQIVLATGNESDLKMDIPGEDLAGVHSATEFVGWYNAHPDFRQLEFDLSKARRVAVVGNGNVAMDVTRILSRDAVELADTDIADYALDALRQSTVEEVVLLGRRGPAQAAFSPKEIKEIGALSAVDLVVDPEELELDPLSLRWLDEQAAPSAKKNVDFLTEQSRHQPAGGGRRVCCRFLVSPVELIGKERIEAVRLAVNELFEDERGTPRPRGCGRFETLEVDLLFKAVGYRGLPLPGVPYDERWGTFPNRDGRLIDPERDEVLPRQYVVGWAKRGPSGLIGTNGPDSEATVAKMLEDVAELPGGDDPERRRDAIVELMQSRDIDFVTFEDWLRLDAEEITRGKKKGKIRDKFADVAEMMHTLHQLRGTTVH